MLEGRCEAWVEEHLEKGRPVQAARAHLKWPGQDSCWASSPPPSFLHCNLAEAFSEFVRDGTENSLILSRVKSCDPALYDFVPQA